MDVTSSLAAMSLAVSIFSFVKEEFGRRGIVNDVGIPLRLKQFCTLSFETVLRQTTTPLWSSILANETPQHFWHHA